MELTVCPVKNTVVVLFCCLSSCSTSALTESDPQQSAATGGAGDAQPPGECASADGAK